MAFRSRILVVSAFVLALAGSFCGGGEAARRRLLESGDQYYSKGQYREAALMYSRAIQQDRLFGEAYFRLAQAQWKLGRLVDAAKALHRAVELQPENSEALSQLCDIYLAALAQSPVRRDVYLRELDDLLGAADRTGANAFLAYRVRGQMALIQNQPESAVDSLRNALRVQPGDRQANLLLVLALLRANHLDEAEALAKEVMEADPSDGEMYDRLYLIYLQQNRPEEAQKLIEEKCRRNPDNQTFQLQLAAHYHRVGDRDKEAGVIQNLESQYAGDFDLGVQIAEFLERTGSYDRAIEQYRRLLARHLDRGVFVTLRLAEAMTMGGRGPEALSLVEDLVRESPDDARARALLGALRLFGGDRQSTEAAINDMEEALAGMPNNAVLRYHLGLAYFAAGDPDKATVRFQEAMGLLPSYEAPRYYLARIYLNKSQPAMAAQLADEILKINPASIRARLVRADASIRIQEYNQARALLSSVLEREPLNTDGRFLLAALNVAERRYRDAEDILRSLYRMAPQDSRGIRGLIGLFMAEGRPQQAQQLLDRELEANPGSRQLRLISAQVAMEAENFDRAISDYSTILESDPNQGSVQVALGLAYYKARDLGKAENHFREAVRVQPGNITANLRLSMLVGELGRFEEARGILQQVLTIAPDNPIALNNMAYILAESPTTLDTALTLAQRAVSRAPGNGFIAETLAWIYYKKNQSDQAIEIYRGLVDRYPKKSVWRYRYAMALMQKGDTPQARRELELALAHAASADEERRIRNLLVQVSR